jgi:zinc/manganese transport system permease protein
MTLFDFSDYDRLIPLVTNSLIAGALLALVGGLIGVFVITRQLSFAVHGVSELSFAGAAIFLLIGLDVVLGSIVGSITAAVIIGTLGSKVQERNSLVAVIMPFGLGLGILALALYPGRAANKFGLLTGQIVTVDDPQVAWLIGISITVLLAIAVFWRPLVFASSSAGYL